MLKGEKIVLRPLLDSDLEFLYKIENDEENWKFGGENKQYSKQELANYISNSKIDINIAKQYRFVIDLKEIPIGFIDLFNYTNASTGVGIIVDKEYRNKGFAKEALNLLIDYAFFALNINQLHAIVTKENIVSSKLFTSCGFVLESEKSYSQYFFKLAQK